MPPVARELTITYGGFSVGGASSTYLLNSVDQPLRVEQSAERASLEFEVECVGSSEAAFASAATALEAAFRKPWQNLTVTQGAQTLIDWSQSANTGLDAVATVTKEGTEHDSGRARRYRIRVEVGRPADYNTGTPGLAESSIELAYDPARRRRVTISGSFTAHDSDSATDRYEAAIETYASAALSALGGTFELLEEQRTHTINDKGATFRLVYLEVLFEQAGAANDTAIVDQHLAISVTAAQDGATPVSGLITRFEARYTAAIDSEVTTNLASKWDSIEPWIWQQMQALSEGGAFAIIESAPEYSFDENRITARVVGIGLAGECVSHEVAITDELDPGTKLEPVWNGKPFAKYDYQGAARLVRTIRQSARFTSDLSPAEVSDRGRGVALENNQRHEPNFNPLDKTEGRWDEGTRTVESTKVKVGLDGQQIDVTDAVITTRWEWYEPVSRSTTPET